MLDMKLLQNIRYVVNSQGEKAAVQVDVATWNMLLGYLEEIEDRLLVKDKLDRLAKGPEQSGAIPWDAVRSEW